MPLATKKVRSVSGPKSKIINVAKGALENLADDIFKPTAPQNKQGVYMDARSNIFNPKTTSEKFSEYRQMEDDLFDMDTYSDEYAEMYEAYENKLKAEDSAEIKRLRALGIGETIISPADFNRWEKERDFGLESAPVDPSRRKFMKEAGATGLAIGALGKLPIGDIIDAPKAVKIADKVAPKIVIPKAFNFSSLNSFMNKIEEAKELAIGEGRADDLDVLDDLQIEDIIDEVGDDEIIEMVSEMKLKFPDATNQEIYEEFSKISDDGLENLDDIFDEDGGFLSAIEKVSPKKVDLEDPVDVDALLDELGEKAFRN